MEENESGLSLAEMASALMRRKYWLIAPAVIGTCVAGVVAMVMDPVYQSSATILIESQQIPTSLVASPVTSYADERIAKIRQQILSRENLVELINKNKLYPDERGTKQLVDIIEMMKNAIKVDLVSANVGSNNSQGKATIAFTLAFDYSDANLTQSVTQQLTSMFIDADVRRRTEQASGTAAFLSRRADELRDRLQKLEGQITAVRARYSGALPDQVLASSQNSASLRSEIARIDIEAQGVMASNAQLATRMQDNSSDPARNELAQAEANLSKLEATYADNHPDVMAARELVRRLREGDQYVSPQAIRPALVQELNSGRSRLALLDRRRAELESEVAKADRLVGLSPQAAYEVNNLQREYDNLDEQYQKIRDRQMEAQVAANLEAEEKGERFTLVDAPQLPEDPIKPNRPMIVFLGLLGGLGFGFALLVLLELVTKPIHGRAGIARLTGHTPLGAVPLSRHGAIANDQPSLKTRILHWLPRKAHS
ncbi:GumC family protein [Sphingomonas hankyongi]|uniref:Wzz/FepE/Etk N-terminal domain-containing protein n=1 Tax=Sphingomonas hankyongi TaxID=2908209 RepID=A0ABT0S2L0_9SPHN|nr:Wzz/FepE/Etk N-terminal domain-containing protein [Sphingomonas hankyongi]MCL6730109.1 Wzz/FepE/Etk N-terminal domain-containing protein [Sphingomonas hankyongi]